MTGRNGAATDGRHDSRNGARLAWTLLAVVVVLTIADLLLMTVNGARGWNGSFGIAGVSTAVPLMFAAMGALVASRQHNNAVGWIFLGTGLSWALGAIAGSVSALSGVRNRVRARTE